MDLALFDFDGTITSRGTYPGFVSSAVRPGRRRLPLLGERYATETLPALIRPAALERIVWHQRRGDQVVVVSASLDVYLEPWCRALGVDVICTQLEAADGRLTGKYFQGDCCGADKTRRIRERYRLADYATIYAYGDTEDDRQMLDMAHVKVFRWQEVSGMPAATRATRFGV